MGHSDESFREMDAPTTISDRLLGTRVDDYELQSLLGEGSMALVYRAVHTVIGKNVAIKVLKPDHSRDPDMVSRLIREARTVSTIHHPGIIEIFGFGRLPSGQPYLVMELLEGEPLDLVIREKAPMPPKDVATLLDELLTALTAAHEVGVIHRDVKPGNILLGRTADGLGRLKLLDFGLARQAGKIGGSVPATNPGTLLGTPAFMAPEQVKGEDVTPATDLYAVGGIAYQLLTGHLPHEGATSFDMVSAKLKSDPLPLRHWQPLLPEALEALILSLLARDSAQRPGSAEEVRQALRRIMGEARAPEAKTRGVLPGAHPSEPAPSRSTQATVLVRPHRPLAAAGPVPAETDRDLSPLAPNVTADAARSSLLKAGLGGLVLLVALVLLVVAAANSLLGR